MKKNKKFGAWYHYAFKKTFRIMRIAVFFLLIGILQSYANSAYSQKTRLSLSHENTRLVNILNEIEDNSEFFFLYNEKLVDTERKVSISVRDKKVDEILDRLFSGTDITYSIVDRKIVLVPGFLTPEQRDLTVSGKVTDTGGQPLPGVSVVVKGTSKGTVTNADGTYSLANVLLNATFQFSFVGMKTLEVAVGNQNNINVTMEELAIGIEEVVAIGYGTMKKSDITGSVASIKMEDMEESPSSRIEQVLQGRLPGVMVQTRSAAPNARLNIRIRGANSINGGNDPLVVIDGFQGGSISTLNPNDIESVEVLKDASATAIYGSRGANGVILVTTKSGKKGKAVISYDSFFSLHQVSKKIDLLNAEQFAQTVNENRTEFGLNPVFTNAEITKFRETGGTDWQDEIFRNAFSHNHLVSVRGGDNNLSYYLSGGLTDTEGIVLNTSYKKYSLRSNVNANLTERLSTNVNIFISKTIDHPIVTSNMDNPVFSALIFSPTKDVYDENGGYTMPGGGAGPPNHYNPVALAKEPVADYYYDETSVNAGLDYKISNSLSLNITGGYRLLDSEENQYVNGKPFGTTGTEPASIIDGKTIYLQNTNQINFNKTINDAHNISLTGVFEQQFVQGNSNTAASIGFLTDALSYNNLGFGTFPQIPSSSKSKRALLSFMGRANYNYKSKYLFTVTARADASSVFGENNKWGYFPSAALGWNVSSEEFMSNLKNVISLFKLRASYGITGNQGISPYGSLARLNTDYTYPINGETLSVGAALGDIANADLEWEKTAQMNIGADMRFFDGRIEFNVDYYDKKTSDLLMRVPLPSAAGGYMRVLRNVGEVGNKGFEIYLGGSPLNGGITWETGITFGRNKNEVLALRGDETSYSLGDAGVPGFNNSIWLEVGQPMGLFKGYMQNGVWKTAEATEAAKYGTIPGAPKLVDQNDDGKINSKDIVATGNAQPDFSYGWNNRFSYKNFDLNIFIQGVYGNEILNLSRVRSEITSGDSDATSIRILNRWTPQNEDTDIPSFTGSKGMKYETSRWVEDGSYLRIKEISLGYKIPVTLLQKLNINSAHIYVSGTNLFTFTNYSGFDPEASTYVDTWGGIDIAPYPSQKIYTVGLNLKF